ncbi:MAG: translational GTPase TypA [Elusimicrobia bacterium]|nr:translational GTPase TypA [Elusimicrobiota bacterium]
MERRNIAIIAHVDHGKTSLVDAMFRNTGVTLKGGEEASGQALDSNDLERERGITILAKCTSVRWKDSVINIVDTPGHADFGGEVERVLKMVDGVLLLVDAVEGPMPQTKFVLRKALAQGLSPIVVVNKMDRPNARPREVVDEVSCLLIDLGADDSQLEFPVFYASARSGWAVGDPAQAPGADLGALFEGILKHVPAPAADAAGPFQMQVTMLDHSSYVGRIGVGRVNRGGIKVSDQVLVVKPDGKSARCKVMKLMDFLGMGRREIGEAAAGDIIAVAGLEGVEVGDTVASPEDPSPLPRLTIDEPTLSMEFFVNDSPFAGREGQFVTSRHIKGRLLREAESNVGLRIEEMAGEGHFKVSGRGELHLSVLIETMRREGFELAVSRPEVVLKTVNGKVHEPTETLFLDIDSQYQGVVFESMGRRGGTMTNMHAESHGRLRLEYVIPARSLIGFKNELLTSTRGTGIMFHSFHGYAPKSGEVPIRSNGVLVAKEAGTSTGYALFGLQDRSVLFIGPGIEVYEGMVVGENSRKNDLVVNPCKQKQMTNMRSKASDESLTLTPPRTMTLEQAIEYIDSDELVEVTPRSIRLRKKVLRRSMRKRAERDDEEEAG